jgi:hypothetical protein
LKFAFRAGKSASLSGNQSRLLSLSALSARIQFLRTHEASINLMIIVLVVVDVAATAAFEFQAKAEKDCYGRVRIKMGYLAQPPFAHLANPQKIPNFLTILVKAKNNLKHVLPFSCGYAKKPTLSTLLTLLTLDTLRMIRVYPLTEIVSLGQLPLLL